MKRIIVFTIMMLLLFSSVCFAKKTDLKNIEGHRFSLLINAPKEELIDKKDKFYNNDIIIVKSNDPIITGFALEFNSKNRVKIFHAMYDYKTKNKRSDILDHIIADGWIPISIYKDNKKIHDTLYEISRKKKVTSADLSKIPMSKLKKGYSAVLVYAKHLIKMNEIENKLYSEDHFFAKIKDYDPLPCIASLEDDGENIYLQIKNLKETAKNKF